MLSSSISRRSFVRVLASGLAFTGAALLQACTAAAPAPAPTQAPAPKPTSAPPAATTAPAVAPTTAPAAAPTTVPAAAPTSAPAVAATPKPAAKPGAVQLPTRVPLTSIKPDLPASEDGSIDPAFVNYPANPPKTVTETPGRGGDVSVMTWTLNAAPTPMDSNVLWQAVNKELGVNLNVSIQPQADYATVKLPTVIAGNDLPDILYIATNAVIPQLPTFLKAKMADLTPYLSGDAIKDYPNLANFAPVTWRQVVFNNAIYGVPVPFPLFLWVHWVHQDLLDRDKLERPKNANEYKQLLQHFTQPNNNLYGMGAENNVGMGTTNGWLTGIFGAPNVWSLDDKTGKLTGTVETEQFKAAVDYARELWQLGVYHPNALQYNLVSARTDFSARKFAFRFDGFQSASVTFWDAAPTLDPPAKPRIMAPFPAVDGGKPTFWASNPTGIIGYSVIKQASPERIKEMLRILNWLAAPMGSQEYLLMNYGQKDVHWTPDEKGNPILNQKGKADALIPFRFITQGPVALYYTRDPAYAQIMQDAEKAMLPFVSINPTDGYYSPTYASKYPAIQQGLYEKINDIVVGRQTMSTWDQVVKEWRDNGGDQIRKEYETEIAAAKG
jgi:putative aldouronate transport system substrate-binding protein